ncbi:hypothetical protein SLS62_001664 [Diatrype stigma]|uniref:Amino acid permease n=1 Tax=Diatrype stigma TaxID=117547 RepID=A0AAN9YRN4_9PEZI
MSLTRLHRMAYFALYNGGPTTFLFSFAVAFCGALSQAASLAEMASLVPIAGAQYHWTYRLAPPRARRLATWVQAWATWFGYLSLLAGVASVTAIQIEAVVVVQLLVPGAGSDSDYDYDYGYTPGGWHTAALIAAVVVPFGLLNAYGFRVVPRLELAAAVLHVVLFVVFVVVLAVYGHHNDAKFIFLRSNVSSGWDEHAYVAWNLGMLSCVWSFTGK